MSAQQIIIFAYSLSCGYLIHSSFLFRFLGSKSSLTDDVKVSHMMYFRILILGLLWTWLVGAYEMDILSKEGSLHKYFESEDRRAALPLAVIFIYRVIEYALVFGLSWFPSLEINHKLNLITINGREPEEFLYLAGKNGYLCLFTMSSGKFYVGWVYDSQPNKDGVDWFAISPLLSGYRNKKDRSLVFTVKYGEHHRKLGKGDRFDKSLITWIPKDDIKSIHRFDIENYAKYYQNQTSHKSILDDSRED